MLIPLFLTYVNVMGIEVKRLGIFDKVKNIL